MKKKALEPILARITRPEVSLSMTIFYYKLRRLDKCTMQPGVIYTTLIKRNVLHFVWLPCLNEISIVLSTADKLLLHDELQACQNRNQKSFGRFRIAFDGETRHRPEKESITARKYSVGVLLEIWYVFVYISGC